MAMVGEIKVEVNGEFLCNATEVKKVRLEPGDVLVLEFPDRLTRAARENISQQIRDCSGVQALVLDGGAKLSAALSRDHPVVVEAICKAHAGPAGWNEVVGKSKQAPQADESIQAEREE